MKLQPSFDAKPTNEKTKSFYIKSKGSYTLWYFLKDTTKYIFKVFIFCPPFESDPIITTLVYRIKVTNRI